MMKVDQNTPQFKSFFEGAKKIVEGHYASLPSMNIHLEFKEGPKYIKIIEQGNQRSAFAFVDRETGDVLKTATWNSPAKHARGNIFDQSNGLKYLGPYGMAYLR